MTIINVSTITSIINAARTLALRTGGDFIPPTFTDAQGRVTDVTLKNNTRGIYIARVQYAPTRGYGVELTITARNAYIAAGVSVDTRILEAIHAACASYTYMSRWECKHKFAFSTVTEMLACTANIIGAGADNSADDEEDGNIIDVTDSAVVRDIVTPVALLTATETPATETPATETPATETPATETPKKKRARKTKKVA